MTAYYAPGVYIEEISAGPRPIAASPTNIAAFIGQTERGPLLTPKRLTGWNDYLETFGDFMEGSYTAESVYGFFRNGGSECFVVRASSGKAARWNIGDSQGNTVLTLSAVSPGPWGNNLRINISLTDQSGSGRLFESSFTLAAERNVTVEGDVTISVRSSVGLAVGQTIRLYSDSADEDGVRSPTTVLGTVQSIHGENVTVTPDSAGKFPKGDGRIVAIAAQGQSVVVLSAASGFRKGDLVKVDVPGDEEQFLQLQESSNSGVGMQLTLARLLENEIPASAFVPKRFTFKTRLKKAVEAGSPESQKIKLEDLETSPGMFELTSTDLTSMNSLNASLETSQGLVAYWNATDGCFSMKGVNLAKETPVTLRLPLFATREIPSMIEVDTLDKLQSPLGFLQNGESVELVRSDGTTATVKKEVTAFTVENGEDNDVINQTFMRIRFPMNSTNFLEGENKRNPVILSFPAEPEKGDWVELSTDKYAQIHSVEKVKGSERPLYRIAFERNVSAGPSVTADHKMLVNGWQTTSFRPMQLGLHIAEMLGEEVRLVEEYGNLSVNSEHANYILREGLVNDVSRLVTVAASSPAGLQVTSRDDLPLLLEFAERGTLVDEVSPTLMKQGIVALEKELDAALVACPDAMLFGKDQELELSDVLNTLIEHCQRMNRFAVLDTPGYINSDDNLLEWRNRTLDTTYAAVYAPWVQIMNQRPNPLHRTQFVPPSGYVMGVIARTDQERGVHKAPANERVQAIVGLKKNYTQNEQSSLNRNSINLIRAFPGRGTRIWGARNVTNDTLWRYVNVRRLFLMVENSIQRNTEWLVFEPNDASTWLAARVTVETFLNGVWRSGGLQGASPEEAYEVRVGKGITMTQADIDLGYLIIEVRIAPVKPAEFVVFRISHKRDA